jgi:hypothetical protein
MVDETLDMSITPDKFKRLSKKNQVRWHHCYANRLTRSAAHLKRPSKVRITRKMAAAQRKWAEGLRIRYGLTKKEVEV